MLYTQYPRNAGSNYSNQSVDSTHPQQGYSNIVIFRGTEDPPGRRARHLTRRSADAKGVALSVGPDTRASIGMKRHVLANVYVLQYKFASPLNFTLPCFRALGTVEDYRIVRLLGASGLLLEDVGLRITQRSQLITVSLDTIRVIHIDESSLLRRTKNCSRLRSVLSDAVPKRASCFGHPINSAIHPTRLPPPISDEPLNMWISS